MSRPFAVLIDGRSATLPRTSGWERYTRSIVAAGIALDKVTVRATRSQSAVKRVLDDWITVPLATRGADFVHYPSYPPATTVPGSRTIMTIHDLTWWRYPRAASTGGRMYYRRLAAKKLRSAALIVTVTRAVADELRELVPYARVAVVSPTVSLPAVAEAPVAGTGKPYFLTVGSIEPRKNLDALFEAFRVSGLQDDFDLVVVGRQAWGRLPAGAVAAGAVSDGQLKYLMRRSAGLVCASLYEGFGLPVVEAVGMGVPVACSRLPALQEVAPDAEFFDPGDIDSISTGLIELAACAGTIGSRDVANPFDPARTSRELVAAYQSLGVEV